MPALREPRKGWGRPRAQLEVAQELGISQMQVIRSIPERADHAL